MRLGFESRHAGTGVRRHGVREALGRSDFYPGNPLVEVRETHIAWVFLAGSAAYKVFKPVRTGSLDLTKLAQRRLACLEELRVKRELAPAIASRVRAIVPGPRSPVLAAEDAAGAVEYAIEMRRFDESRTMASLAQAGLLTNAHVGAVARRLAAFHAAAPSCWPRDRVAAVMRANRSAVCELRDLAGEDAARSVAAIGRFVDAFALTHGPEIAARADAGFVRDGHGDLRAANVVLDERLSIVDRPARDPRLRELDVAEDFASLVMDLERIGDRPAAELLVQRYWEAGGELCSPELLAFYGVGRALARAQAELRRARQRADDATAPAALQRAAELLGLAERLAWRARGPVVLAIGGPAATGDSKFAAEVSRRIGLEVLSPDRLRGYRELGERAREVVVEGQSVIVDATLGDPRARGEFVEGLRDRGALRAVEIGASTNGARDAPGDEAILTIRPPAAVEDVVDRIADWLDARRSPVCLLE